MKDYSELFKDQECKSLPRKDSGGYATFFEANGRKYKIRDAKEGIPILRWSAYEKLNLMFGYNATIQKLHDNQLKTKTMLNEILLKKGDAKHSVIDVIQHQDSIISGLKGFSTERANKALYLCTIFIVVEGEDIKTWGQSVAEQKIDDWIEEGFDISDFFTLAAVFSPEWLKLTTKGTGNG